MRSQVVFILFLILLADCSDKKNADLSLKIKNQLAGAWMDIGTFENNIPMYDSVYIRFEDTDDSVWTTMIHGIWTDSGMYEHFYDIESSELLKIDTVAEFEIYEYNFLTDTTGFINNYQFSPSRSYKEHPRIQGFKQNFQLEITDSIPVIMIENADGTISTPSIKNISKKKLELGWGDKITNKFEKINVF